MRIRLEQRSLRAILFDLLSRLTILRFIETTSVRRLPPMATLEQVESFYQFATERLKKAGSANTIDELYDDWRSENQTPDEIAEDIAAIQASIDDMNRGERGRDSQEVIDDIRAELNRP